MVTQCTVCRVWFRINREQLRAAHGLARCSQCNTVFNALATLRHDPPHDLHDGDSGEFSAEDDEPPSVEAVGGYWAATPLPLPLGFAESTSNAGATAGRDNQRIVRWIWRLACLLLLAALLGQIGYRFIGMDSLNLIVPWVHGNDGPRGRLVLKNYQLTATASELGDSHLLNINATLRNKSHRNDALPLLALKLTDINGHVVGSRLLGPKMYAPGHDAYLEGTHMLKVHVKVADPGSTTVGFSLSLCKKIRVKVYCLP